MAAIIVTILGAVLIGILWAAGIAATDPEEMEQWREEDESDL